MTIFRFCRKNCGRVRQAVLFRTINIAVVVTLGIVGQITFLWPCRADSPLSSETALKWLDAASHSIRTCDVFYRVEFSYFMTNEGMNPPTQLRKLEPNEPRKTRTKSFRFVQGQDKQRFDVFSELYQKPESTWVAVSGVAKKKMYKRPSFSVTYRPQAPCGPGEDYRDSLGEIYSGHNLLRVLRSRKSIRAVTEDDGKVNLQVDAEDEPRIIAGRLGFKVALDPAHGLMPVKLEESEKGKVHLVTEVLEWKELGAGVFAPVRIRSTMFQRLAHQFPGELYCTADIVVEKERSTWNQLLDQSLFVLLPETGSPVHDEVQGTLQLAGDGHPGKNIDKLVSRTIQLHEEPAVPASVGPSAKLWLVVGGAVIIATALVAWLGIRFRRSN